MTKPSSGLRKALAVLGVHCVQCKVCTVYTVHSVHCTQCTVYTVYTVHSVLSWVCADHLPPPSGHVVVWLHSPTSSPIRLTVHLDTTLFVCHYNNSYLMRTKDTDILHQKIYISPSCPVFSYTLIKCLLLSSTSQYLQLIIQSSDDMFISHISYNCQEILVNTFHHPVRQPPPQ